MQKSKIFLSMLAFLLVLASCQKMKRPAMGDYPTDYTVTPTSELRFYIPFDSSAPEQRQINLRFRDSISKYPTYFPVNSISVVNGARATAINNSDTGSNSYQPYVNVNDFLKSSSMSVAFWMKHNGVPADQAQFVFAFPSTVGHWSGGTFFLLLDHTGSGATNNLAVLKMVIVDKNGADNWFTWEGANKIPGIQDNNWHHLAFTYDATSSKMILYVDGVANANQPTWGTHGALNIDFSKAGSLKLMGAPAPRKDMGWGASYVGGLDQFRLYNKALSATEVQALFNSHL